MPAELPGTNRVAVYYNNADVRYETQPMPQIGPAETLVRIHASGICGSDVLEWYRVPKAPIVLGHEVAGEVVSVGKEVHHPPVGTFVAVETHLFCGHCRMCRTGRAHICENLRIVGVDVDGVFAEYVVVPAVNAWEVDPRIPPESASVQEPFGNAVHTVFAGDGSDLELATVVILGCGPIGLFAVGVARAAGARQVIAVEPNDFRLNLAKQMGADVLVDPGKDDPVDAVRAATDGRGAEVVLEMSGVPKVIDQGTHMLDHGGRMSLLGLPPGPVTLDLTDQVIFKEARLLGVTGRELFRTWEQTTTLLATGMVDVAPVITHRFPLERFEEAFDVVASGRSGKVILLPGAS